MDKVLDYLDSDGRPALIIEGQQGREAWVLPYGSDTWHSINYAYALNARVLSRDEWLTFFRRRPMPDLPVAD